MFQAYFHIHLWPIRGINTTLCQKCFKSETSTSIQLPKEKGREIQALQPPGHIYTRDTTVEQYTRSQAAAKFCRVSEHYTLHYKPCQKCFPKLVLAWARPNTTKSMKDTWDGSPMQKTSSPAYYPKNPKPKSVHISISVWEMIDTHSWRSGKLQASSSLIIKKRYETIREE